MARKKERPAIHVGNEYIKEKREEFLLCLTKGCRNVIASWATGAASNGYCAACRKSHDNRRSEA